MRPYDLLNSCRTWKFIAASLALMLLTIEIIVLSHDNKTPDPDLGNADTVITVVHVESVSIHHPRHQP